MLFTSPGGSKMPTEESKTYEPWKASRSPTLGCSDMGSPEHMCCMHLTPARINSSIPAGNN